MGRFDPEANVSRFARMLYNETDPAKRARLRQLLVDGPICLALVAARDSGPTHCGSFGTH